MAFTILVDETIVQVDEVGLESEEGSLEYKWNLGEDRPMPNSNPWYLEATGEELAFIGAKFANMPIRLDTGRCVWYDEMAKFIFNNLPLEGKE